MSWVTMKTVMPISSHSAEQQLVHVAADAGIERAERLVEQEELRPHQQRLGDGEALLHAAGKLRRVALAGVGEADPVEDLLDLARRAPAALRRTGGRDAASARARAAG